MSNKKSGGRSFRVALMGIYHESNTFISTHTVLKDFSNGHLLRGEAIRVEYENAYHEIGGMLEVLDRNNIETIPVMFAEATPGGIITKETYELLLNEMFHDFQNHFPLDACLVIPHGAGVADGYPDMDGHWLSILRNAVGPNIPIIGTLDPHANASELMVLSTDALIAYKTNPHLDQREVGKMAAELLVKTLHKEIKPVQWLTQSQVAISIEQQNTSVQPCKELYNLAAEICKQPGILSVSILLGFPYADVIEMGSSFIVVTDDRQELAITSGEVLKSRLLSLHRYCTGERNEIISVLPTLMHKKKPVLLLDMGDNIGGGSPGDSTFLLEVLENHGIYKSFACIYDPEAIKIAARYSKNDTFELAFGNHPVTRKKIIARVRLLDTANGKFSEKNPRHGGQMNFDMGRIAIIQTARGNIVLLNSLRVPPFSLSQLTSFGIDPQQFDILVAKGVNAPIAAYRAVCSTIVQINTPGVTQADMTVFPFKNRRKPLYPFENLIE